MPLYPNTLNRLSQSLRVIGATTAVAGAKTTFPSSGDLLYELDPDVVTGVTNGTRVKSVPDATRSITATAPGAWPCIHRQRRERQSGVEVCWHR